MIPLNSPMKLAVSFADDTGAAFDPPTGVKIKIKDPRGGVTTLNYPADLTKTSVGNYFGVVQANKPGEWVGVGQGTLANGQPVTTPDVIEMVSSSEVP